MHSTLHFISKTVFRIFKLLTVDIYEGVGFKIIIYLNIYIYFLYLETISILIYIINI